MASVGFNWLGQSHPTDLYGLVRRTAREGQIVLPIDVEGGREVERELLLNEPNLASYVPNNGTLVIATGQQEVPTFIPLETKYWAPMSFEGLSKFTVTRPYSGNAIV